MKKHSTVNCMLIYQLFPQKTPITQNTNLFKQPSNPLKIPLTASIDFLKNDFPIHSPKNSINFLFNKLNNWLQTTRNLSSDPFFDCHSKSKKNCDETSLFLICCENKQQICSPFAWKFQAKFFEWLVHKPKKKKGLRRINKNPQSTGEWVRRRNFIIWKFSINFVFCHCSMAEKKKLSHCACLCSHV